ncbi:MAG: hypothetical protein ACTSPD_21170 [Promethearchaeota archaeon]
MEQTDKNDNYNEDEYKDDEDEYDEEEDIFINEFEAWLNYPQWALSTFKNDVEIIKHIKNDLNKTHFLRYKDFLGSEIMKRLFDKKFYGKELLKALIIDIHIKFELAINEILKDKLGAKEFRWIKKSKFSQKLERMEKYILIDEDLLKDLRLFNQLRNKLAHVNDYDIAQFNMNKFSYCDELYNNVKTHSKEAKRYLNMYFIKYILYYMLGRLDMDYPIIRKIKYDRL